MDKALAHDDSILQAREVLEHDFVVLFPLAELDKLVATIIKLVREFK